MSIKTVTVNTLVETQEGEPVEGATVLLRLDQHEFDNGFVVPAEAKATTDANGEASLHVWPNERGSNSSVYRVLITKGSTIMAAGKAAIPDVDVPVSLDEYMKADAFPTRSVVEALVAQASASAQEVSSVADNTNATLKQTTIFTALGL